MNDTGMTTIEDLLRSIETRTGNLHAQLKELVAENKALRRALEDLEFIFESLEDIKDGPDGQQLPNDAMQAMGIIRLALYGGHP